MEDLITGKSFPVEVRPVNMESVSTCIVVSGVRHLDTVMNCLSRLTTPPPPEPQYHLARNRHVRWLVAPLPHCYFPCQCFARILRESVLNVNSSNNYPQEHPESIEYHGRSAGTREPGSGLDPENWPEDSSLRRHLNTWPVRAGPLAGCLAALSIWLRCPMPPPKSRRNPHLHLPRRNCLPNCPA